MLWLLKNVLEYKDHGIKRNMPLKLMDSTLSVNSGYWTLYRHYSLYIPRVMSRFLLKKSALLETSFASLPCYEQ